MSRSSLLHVQQSAPEDFPALLSTARPGEPAEHLLFAALDSPLLCHSAEQLRNNLGRVSWRARPTNGSQPEVGDEGWLVYLSYEAAAAFVPAGRLQMMSCAPLPIAVLQRVRLAQRQRQSLEQLPQVLDSVAAHEWVEEPPAAFLSGFERIQEYLRAGDVYQVNLSRRWQASTPISGEVVFQRLLKANAAPFAARAIFPGFEVISSSPERLFEARGLHIRTQPIAGTRPRGATLEQDAQFRSELRAHPKEQAEHIMLVDLERNDLGRVCQPGSVQVPRLLAVEPYASVQHLVSDVCGELRPGTSLAQILQAVFPGGTITGCPKIRCMQILTELESTPRHAYTGSLGYCMDNGAVDFNILIRTVLKTQQHLHLSAGGGIVVASQAQAELDETRAKARGVISALAGSDAS